MTTLPEVWPLFGLSLTTPRLVLRPLRDEDIPAFVDAAASGIHDEPGARTPFAIPWDESPDLGPKTARWIWEARLRAAPEDWAIMFGIFTHDGALLGSQDIAAKHFPALKTFATGSWLRGNAHRLGYGTEMRAAVLMWAFDRLGAEIATTAAFEWNAASLGVSRRLGYEPNGEARHTPRPGVVERELRFRLPKEAFRRPDWELQVEGHAAAAAFLGVPAVGT